MTPGRPAQRREGFVRRHPGRCALLGGAVALVLVGAALAVRSGGRSTEAGKVDPRGPATAAAGEISGEAAGVPGPAGGGASTTAATPAGAGDRRQPGASTAGTSRRPGAVSDAAPVAPRDPVRCAAKGTPAAAPLPPADESDGRRWVTVGRLTGACDAASAPFRLLGIDTRLAWRSDADSFAVFVVDVVGGREATAGFADGQCAGSCSESQPIVPAAGEYRLEVQAGAGPWEVEVQEYRRP